MIHYLLPNTHSDEPINSTVGIIAKVLNMSGVDQETTKRVLEHLVYKTQRTRVESVTASKATRDTTLANRRGV
jgi:hypothetical protein